jgi:large subunit ribosomal protein L4
MKANLLNLNNQIKGEVELNPLIFGKDPRTDIMHRVVLWQMAKKQAGTHSTKEIGDVEGSTRKIYRQKGTGRARHGAIRAPQFRGGGVIFGPHFRDHSFSLNKKVKRLGLLSALSLKRQMNSIIVLDELRMDTHKTSVIQKKLQILGALNSLIVDSIVDKKIVNSVANINGVNVLPVEGLNVLDILKHSHLVVTLAALKMIEERLI